MSITAWTPEGDKYRMVLNQNPDVKNELKSIAERVANLAATYWVNNMRTMGALEGILKNMLNKKDVVEYLDKMTNGGFSAWANNFVDLRERYSQFSHAFVDGIALGGWSGDKGLLFIAPIVKADIRNFLSVYKKKPDVYTTIYFSEPDEERIKEEFMKMVDYLVKVAEAFPETPMLVSDIIQEIDRGNRLLRQVGLDEIWDDIQLREDANYVIHTEEQMSKSIAELVDLSGIILTG